MRIMCGRFALDVTREELEKRFRASVAMIQITPSYNVTPGLFIPTVVRESPNQIKLMKWGLIPFWSREPRVKFSTINARAETIDSSPVFRKPFASQRCLIPAIGFYEWKRQHDGSKQPYFIHVKSHRLFSLAGVYDIWTDVEHKQFWSCSIVTTMPNDIMESIHNRMPVILPAHQEEHWLNKESSSELLKSMLKPYPSSDMEVYSVSTRVNNPNANDVSLIKRN